MSSAVDVYQLRTDDPDDIRTEMYRNIVGLLSCCDRCDLCLFTHIWDGRCNSFGGLSLRRVDVC